MSLPEKLAKTKVFQYFAIFLLMFSMITTALSPNIAFAEEPSNRNIKDGHGSIKNEQDEIDYDEATINKQVSFGNKPGEFFIDLTVKGKSRSTLESMDIAVAYDNSNSMDTNNRVGIAKTATDNFVNGLLTQENNQLSKGYQMALVTYGSAVFDGRERTWLSNPGSTVNWSHKTLTKNSQQITSKIPSTTPQNRTDGGSGSISQWHGGTFTQQAVQELEGILDGSNADHKVAVIITDGATTLSQGSRGVEGNGSTYTSDHGTRTLNQIKRLKDKGYTVYSVGIEMGGENGITKAEAEQLVRDMATSPEHAFLASNVQEVQSHLESIAAALDNTVRNGSITDPITDEFILPENPFGQAGSDQLEDGEYFLSASNPSLLDGVTVKSENQHIKVDGLNLGEGEWVKVRYKVQIDTNNHELDPNKFYKTNGTTTLTPNGDDPENKREFPEPEAAAEPLKVKGKKAWADWGYDVHRPAEITLQLVREINGQDVVVDETTIQNNGTDVWDYEFEDAFVYDTTGNKIEYKIREIMPGDSSDYYEYEFGGITPETTDVRNLFKQDAKIQLVKTAKSTSELGEDEIEVGKDINYTFEFTNTGNLPLKDISLKDELDGISAITYETLNGEPLTQDIADVIMQPGDVIVATATYKVTQEDFNYGQVDNHAEVVGTPTVPNPNQFGGQMNEFDDTPVRDDDDAAVPGSLDPAISLTKTADKEKVSEVGEEIEYTFEFTNTGNTTLTEVTLNDPMLGGEITLEVDTLEPGESTTVKVAYEVTQEDINAEEIVNEADVEGTPPPAYTNNPDNPDKVTDDDDEIVKASQESSISLVKEADKDELKVDETITYTFTATNTGNTTLTNVKITDVLEGISGINYLTVNGQAIADSNNITLQPGDVLVANATYEVTQDDVDLGQVFNEATVTGIDPKDEEVTDKDDEAVPSNPELGIELVKTSDKQYVTEAGQEVTYTFKVTNTSNVSLTGVVVNDPMLDDLDIDIELEKTTLKPGESTTGTATYKVTTEDIEAGNIKNIATSTGTPPNPKDEPPTSPPAEDEVPVAKIQLEKSSNTDVYTQVGQEIIYTFVITNTGNITLNEVTLTDEMLGGAITLDVNSLKPGESTTVEVPYKVTAEDLQAGEILNTADTEGTPEGYDPEDPNTPGKVTDEDDDKVLGASITIEKTSDKEEVTEAGEVITYTFTVTNTGKTVLENVEVNDQMLADLGIKVEIEKTTLKPGESTTGTATYTVTQKDIDNGGVYNVATSTGTPPGYDPEDPDNPYEPPVSPPDEENVPAKQDAKISLDKSADIDKYTKVGDDITYTFTVTNTGNVTLTDVKVDDVTFKVPIELGKTTLEPGESTTGSYTHTITQADLDNGEIHNFANTEGTPPPVIDPVDPDNPVAQDPVRDEDDEKVSGEQDISLVLEKVADKQEVEQAGDEITYTLTVTNKGNVTLDHVTVNDEMLGGDLAVTPSTLAPGETGTVTGTYTVTQEDIDNKDQIINIATATGTPPGGDPEDPDNPKTPPTEEEVPVVNDPEITLVKLADKEKLVAGETITYTFTATNTGNTTLNKVNLVDELEGISEIEYVTVNGDEIADPENITLLPGDVLVASATYEVTQADVNANEVYNHATVEGTPPAKDNPEDPDNPIEQDPVTDDDDAKVPSEHKPELALEKTTEKEVVTEAGEVITYKFVVTNTGNVTMDHLKVDDPMLAELGIEIVLDKDTLAPGESAIGYADYTVTQEDIDNVDNIVNIATATGTPPGGDPEDPDNPKTPPSEEEVPVVKHPEIAIEKTAEEEKVCKAGETITYNFVVTNTGNVTLDNVKVNDPMLDKAGVEIELETTILAPGESTKGSAVYTVTQADIDNGIVKNIATSTGTPPGYDPENPPTDPEDPTYPPVSPPDEVEVPVEQNAKIKLDKVADKQEYTKVGEEVTYTFTVTNTGNVTLTNVNVYDETFDFEVSIDKTTLAPGESATGTFTYKVTQADLDKGMVHNLAKTEGTPPPVINPEDPDNPVTQDPVTDEDDETVKTKVNADLALEKKADKQEVEKAGDVITYTLTVTNTGNVTLSNVTVNDKMLGGDLEVTPSTLAPGEQGTVTGTYTVTQADIDNKVEIKNIATATGTPPGGDPEDPDNPKTPPVEEDVPVVNDPEITLVKQADKEKLVEGETITYTFTATNTGNVTLEKVNLTDELEGISEINYLTVNGEVIEDANNITLLPGDVLIAKATYVVTLDDVNRSDIYNHAIVEGTPPAKENPEDPENPIAQEPVTDDDDVTVPSEHKPELTLEKSTAKEKVTKAGEVITYKFVVTNTGNVTLDHVKVNDPMLEELGIKVELEKVTLIPGESTIGYAEYTVTQDDIDNQDKIVNIATATGTPPEKDPEDPDNPVSPPDREEVPVEKESNIQLVKEADKQEVTSAGEKVTFTFTVTNIGNVTLKDVKVYDETLKQDVKVEKTTLAPGESTEGSLTYTVTQADIDNGEFVNLATAEGTPPNYDPEDPTSEKPRDEDEEKVKANQNPNISLEKTSDVEKVTTVGQEITYTFVATNTGNVTLTDVVLDDPMLKDAKIKVELDKATLAPGESATAKVVYKVTKKDLEKSELINVATVTGTPPNYNPDDPNSPQKPTDEDTDIVPVEKPIDNGSKLPNTATNTLNYLLIGFVLLVLGGAALFIRKRKSE